MLKPTAYAVGFLLSVIAKQFADRCGNHYGIISRILQ